MPYESHFDSMTETTASVSSSTSAGPVRIFYKDAKPISSSSNTHVILLIHGFPETSHQFRHAIPLLAKAGYRVIAPDYRGAGYSSKPRVGDEPGANYTKRLCAQDLHELMHETLSIKAKYHVVGHDIGGMVAHAYAALYPNDIKSVIWGEVKLKYLCPLPGSRFYEEKKGSVGLFHFVFHSLPDLPEALISGREAIYLRHFYDKLALNPAFMAQADFDIYVQHFSQPGAMTAGLELYRAFELDAEDNRQWREKNGKIKVPSLCLMGESSLLQEGSETMNEDFYEGGQVAKVKKAGHWLAEENPQGFVDAILAFIEKHA